MEDYKIYETLLEKVGAQMSVYRTALHQIESPEKLGEKELLRLGKNAEELAQNLARLYTERDLAQGLARQKNDGAAFLKLENKLEGIQTNLISCEQIALEFEQKYYEMLSIHHIRRQLDSHYNDKCAEGERKLMEHLAEKNKPYA